MNYMLKPTLVLLTITVVAASLLAVVYDVTEEPIAQQEIKAKNEAMQAVMEADSYEDIDLEDESVTSVTKAIQNDELIGYIVGVAPKGYSGNVNTMVGFELDGTVKAIEIVSQTETPGLGANCVNPEFKDQFKGKTPELTVSKQPTGDENEIVAMTSSTITTTAVTDGVNTASVYFNTYLKGDN